MDVLLVDVGRRLPDEAAEFLALSGHKVEVAVDFAGALSMALASDFDAVVLPLPGDQFGDNLDGNDLDGSDQDGGDQGGSAGQTYAELMRAIQIKGIAALVLAPAGMDSPRDGGLPVHFASGNVTKEELHGRLATIDRYHGMVRSMQHDLDNMQRLFRQLNLQFAEVDQEMRLAGRLQRHFLPHRIDDLGPARFFTLYRPASFVSGDIYDVYRVDEEHIAFYVADAVGHGMAASLLTMFIKNAVISKHVERGRYEIFDPSQTLSLLNDTLVRQMLPSSQFVSICYALFNTRTLELQYARAGHPYPLLCTTEGRVSELKVPGGLLGLFGGEQYPTRKLVLRPGEKVILYTDGLELAFAPAEDRENELLHYRKVLADLAHLSADRVIEELGKTLDAEFGSVNPKDDITVLTMEVGDSSD